jgi:hypothetical protein
VTSPDFKQELKSYIDRVGGFSGWIHADKIRFFAWFQHSVRGKPWFVTGDIAACFDAFQYQKPNISQFLKEMEKRKPKVFIRNGNGYALEGKIREEYDRKYLEHEIVLNIRQQVKDLINSIPNIAEKEYMQEAQIVLRHDAGRATIIMVWCIAFYHLGQFILKHHLNVFNNRIPIRYPNAWDASDMPLITKYDDFGDEMTERQVIEVANSANIINKNLHEILAQKLKQRNGAAHPSSVKIGQLQAENYVDDIVKNVILALPI